MAVAVASIAFATLFYTDAATAFTARKYQPNNSVTNLMTLILVYKKLIKFDIV